MGIPRYAYSVPPSVRARPDGTSSSNLHTQGRASNNVFGALPSSPLLKRPNPSRAQARAPLCPLSTSPSPPRGPTPPTRTCATGGAATCRCSRWVDCMYASKRECLSALFANNARFVSSMLNWRTLPLSSSAGAPQALQQGHHLHRTRLRLGHGR